MSRGLLLFLFFCLVLTVVCVVGASVLGPHKLDFVFHKARSTEPFVMIGLSHADFEGQEFAFEQELSASLTELGGKLSWGGKVVEVLEGRINDEWSAVVLSQYPSRTEFIKQFTDSNFKPPFGLVVKQTGQSLMLAAAPVKVFDMQSGVYFLEFMQFSENEILPQSYLSPDQVLPSGAQGVWQAAINPVSAGEDQEWQYVKMTGFENRLALNTWLNNLENKTQAALRQRYYRNYVSLVVAPW